MTQEIRLTEHAPVRMSVSQQPNYAGPRSLQRSDSKKTGNLDNLYTPRKHGSLYRRTLPTYRPRHSLGQNIRGFWTNAGETCDMHHDFDLTSAPHPSPECTQTNSSLFSCNARKHACFIKVTLPQLPSRPPQGSSHPSGFAPSSALLRPHLHPYSTYHSTTHTPTATIPAHPHARMLHSLPLALPPYLLPSTRLHDSARSSRYSLASCALSTPTLPKHIVYTEHKPLPLQYDSGAPDRVPTNGNAPPQRQCLRLIEHRDFCTRRRGPNTTQGPWQDGSKAQHLPTSAHNPEDLGHDLHTTSATHTTASKSRPHEGDVA
jgi:hypothetical protein